MTLEEVCKRLVEITPVEHHGELVSLLMEYSSLQVDEALDKLVTNLKLLREAGFIEVDYDNIFK